MSALIMFAVKNNLNFIIMLKKILNFNGTQALGKNEQSKISGGWDSQYCQRLLATWNCSHPNWVTCGGDPCDDQCLTLPGTGC